MGSIGSKLRVLIPTTKGPVEVLLLTEEDRSVGRSVACIGGTTKLADIDGDYQAFVARPSGVIERLFGEPCYRIDFSQPIETGDSWQLGVLVAHALHAEGRLAQEGEEADGIVWATGAVRAVGLTVAAVGHLKEKLCQSMPRLQAEAGAGRKVLAIIPARNAADLPPELRAGLTGLAEIAEVPDVAPVWARLGLTVDRDAGRKGLPARRAWSALAAVAMCAALTGAYMMLAIPRRSAPQAGAAPAAAVARPVIRDCDMCPEMVELPSGDFLMGSPDTELGRKETEGPPRRVTIGKRFAIGRFEITRDQFAAHLKDIGETDKAGCKTITRPEATDHMWGPPDASFLRPGYDTTGSYPAGCISWHDASAYAAWLSRRTGKPYRLPTEAEWEYAARAGTATRFSFGADDAQLCGYARFADLASRFEWRTSCRSAITSYGPVAVGQLKPNPWGLFDMHGNVWEWVEDCWSPDWQRKPSDASAFARPGSCEIGVIRGGSFAAGAARVRSASRWPQRANTRLYHLGFRVARDLDGE